MRSIRALIATSVVAALAIAAMAAPASAASMGRMTVVNGIPGTKIDICIGSRKEIRSGLRYGGAYKKQLIGVKKLRFRKASPGTCKGKILSGKTIGFPSGSDKTVVVTSKVPKVLVFDNAGLGIQAATTPDAAMALRHAADLSWNTIHFVFTSWIVKDKTTVPPTLSLEDDPDKYEKGMQYAKGAYSSPTTRSQVSVTRPDEIVTLVESSLFEVKALRRYEFIFVGTKTTNVKLVRVISGLSSPPAS